MQYKTVSLTPEARNCILRQATESPFVSDNVEMPAGSYLCRRCGLALFRAMNKFNSGCGWPSFDEQIPNAVVQRLDRDGQRTEIICARCHAHLGHVFRGEQLTDKNVRYCVNSISLDFVTDDTILDTEEALFAGGCFWGIEYYFQRLPGVIKTEVGYMGGHKQYPTYQQICEGHTGHFEAVRIIYDPANLSYEKLARYFLEIHDPTQHNRQGPDIGEQYSSVIFYYNEIQKTIAEKILAKLRLQLANVETSLRPVTIFWPAEAYHQNYYAKNNQQPYCHG